MLNPEQLADLLAKVKPRRGKDGKDGKDGRNGLDGIDGKDGAPGLPGGPRGPAGKDGDPGRDAYELALEQGFAGDRESWIKSLHGKQGDPGRNGKDGLQGPRGEQGPKGDDGEIGPMPHHEWEGTKLRFEQFPGKWGKFVDLQGPRGPDGAGRTGHGMPINIGGGIYDPPPAAATATQFTYFPSGWN